MLDADKKAQLDLAVKEFGWYADWMNICREQKDILASYDTFQFPWNLTLWDGSMGRTALTLPGAANPFAGNLRWCVSSAKCTPYLLRYDREQGRAVFPIPFPNGYGPSHREQVKKIQRAFSAAARLATFEPGEYGLEIELLSERDRITWVSSILMDEFKKGTILTTAGEYVGGDATVSSLQVIPNVTEYPHPGWLQTIPPFWVTGLYGWHSPSVQDSYQFAVPYLSPIVGDNDNDEYPYTERWGLYLNGLPKPLRTAAWNDREALQELVYQVVEGDEESQLVHYALAYGLSDIEYSRHRHNASRLNPFLAEEKD